MGHVGTLDVTRSSLTQQDEDFLLLSRVMTRESGGGYTLSSRRQGLWPVSDLFYSVRSNLTSAS